MNVTFTMKENPMKRRKDRLTSVFGLARGGLCFAALLVVAGCCGQNVPENLELRITSPVDGADAKLQSTVTGEVSEPKVQVHVLVHPVTTDQWWVQRPPSAGQDGKWKTTVFFGTKSHGIDEEFEVLAIATRKCLEAGDTIDVSELPTDGVRSLIVTVTRRL